MTTGAASPSPSTAPGAHTDAGLLGRVPLLRDPRPAQLATLAAPTDLRRVERGRQIPREGRLMAAVEPCESLRPRIAQPGVDGRGRPIGELRRQAGRQLDREMVVALCRVLEAEEHAGG
jgi:hypothetical protein